MAAALALSPASGTITQGGTFTAPTFTATNDSSKPILTPTVTGPVPAVDVNKVGTQSLVYTLTKANTDVAVAAKATYTLTVTAKPTPPSGSASFKDGSTLRDGHAGTAEYKADVTEGNTIQSPDVEVPAKSAALFDEQGLDPYEVNNAQ